MVCQIDIASVHDVILNTHNYGAFYEHFDAQKAAQMTEKLDFTFTPKNSSWLNMIEIEQFMFQKVEANPEDALELRFSDPDDESKRLLAQITNPIMTYKLPVHQQSNEFGFAVLYSSSSLVAPGVKCVLPGSSYLAYPATSKQAG